MINERQMTAAERHVLNAAARYREADKAWEEDEEGGRARDLLAIDAEKRRLELAEAVDRWRAEEFQKSLASKHAAFHRECEKGQIARGK